MAGLGKFVAETTYWVIGWGGLNLAHPTLHDNITGDISREAGQIVT
jgi:hypothetical protein